MRWQKNAFREFFTERIGVCVCVMCREGGLVKLAGKGDVFSWFELLQYKHLLAGKNLFFFCAVDFSLF